MKPVAVVSILATAFLLTGQGSHAQTAATADPVARMVGISLGATPEEITARAQALGARCSRSGADAIVCDRSLGAQVAPLASTFWLVNGRVARIFETNQTPGRNLDEYLGWNRALRTRAERVLGAAPSAQTDFPAGWSQQHSAEENLAAIASGKVGLNIEWTFPAARIAVALRGENRTAVLVVSIVPTNNTATAPPNTLSCPSSTVAAALMDLFPPASAEARSTAAGILAACRVTRAAGALGAALTQDPDETVRMQAARALAKVQAPAAQAILDEALAAHPTPRVRAVLEELTRAEPRSEPTPPRPAPARTVVAEAPADAATPALGAQVRQKKGLVTKKSKSAEGTNPSASPIATPSPVALALAPRSPAIAAPPPAPMPPAPAPIPPPSPPKPMDGTALAITTSIAAGGIWGGALSLLAQQNSPGVVTLVGSAGAVIGGGTAWGLTKFGMRPSPTQAMWFANATTWGTLAGLTAWSGSGSESQKLKYGLLIGGESVGIAAGIWGARGWSWTPGQVLMANTLVLGAGLGTMGVERLRTPAAPLAISPAIGYGTAPAMVLATVASRYIRPSTNDLKLMSFSSVALGWTGGLLGGGIAGTRWLSHAEGQGGLMLGLGAGYVGAALASPFVEVSQEHLLAASAGLVAGNTFGLGLYMLASPEDNAHWTLGAALGGVGLGLTTMAAAPFVHPGPKALPMTVAGTLYGAGIWTLALQASSTGQPADARVAGGLMVGGVGAGIAGLLASQRFAPEAGDQLMAATATGLGMSTGLGLSKLTTGEKGLPEFVGVIAGAAGGFGGGVLLSQGPPLKKPALFAGTLGGGYGLFLGSLAPTLHLREWNAGRQTAGGAWLGLGVGAAGGTLLARAVDPSSAQIGVVSLAGAAGLGMGFGAGLLMPTNSPQASRIGAVAGSATLALGAGLLEPTLRLTEGFGPNWAGMTTWGAGLGYLEGTLAGSALRVHDGESGASSATADRQTKGGQLLGTTAGAVTGLVLSKWARPGSNEYTATISTSLLGLSLGHGVGHFLFAEDDDRRAPVLRMSGSLLGLAAGATSSHFISWRGEDFRAGMLGLGYGGLIGSLLPSLQNDSWRNDRFTVGGAWSGLAIGGVGAAILGHATEASDRQTATIGAAGGLGLSAGMGLGMMLPTDSSQSSRVGAVAGSTAFMGGAALLSRPLRLDEGFSTPGAPGMFVSGGLLGASHGLMLAGLIGEGGTVSGVGNRQGWGGVLMGTSLGGTSGLVLSRFVRPTPADHAVVFGGSILGGSLGLGTSMLLTSASGRPDTAATLFGSAAGITAAATTQHLSPLNSTSSPDAPAMFVSGGLLGASHGFMVSRLLNDKPPSANADGRHSWGGVLMGTSLGGTSGLVLSRFVRPTRADHAAVLGGSVLGGTMGLGTTMLLSSNGGRPDTAGTMLGSFAGITAAAATQHVSPLIADDLAVMPVGLGFGGLIGSLSPGLGSRRWAGLDRTTSGGLLLGLSGGTMGAVALRRAAGATPGQFGTATLGGLDGMVTGLGVGLLVDDSSSTQVQRIGTVAGSVAGLGIGATLWPRLTLGPTDGSFITGATLLGAWHGAWIPFLGHSDTASVDGQKIVGGLMLGAGGTSLIATALAPRLELDEDLMLNAAAMDGIFSFAGAGMGALFSRRTDAPVWGLMGGGAAGLVLGAAAHRAIQIDEQNQPLLTLAPIQGAWLGAWLPHLLYANDEVDGRRQLGGVAAGAFGATAVATLASPFFKPDVREASMAGVGSAIGASIAGGVVLLSSDLEGRSGVGVLLGGSALGLSAGALIGPHIEGHDSVASSTMLGSALGASEGLVFAWAGRAASDAQYAGATLVGAGLGATLGLSTALRPSTETSKNFTSLGFSAWGAWMGSFGGALLNRDPHEVTLGGAAGANLGFLAGHLLQSNELIAPRDFGWVSLLGASGAVAGGVLGATLSTRDNATPVLVGLSLGPLVGMTGGALFLPKLRALSRGSASNSAQDTSAPPRLSQADVLALNSAPPTAPITSAPILSENQQERSVILSRAKQLFNVSEWTPTIGALPQGPGAPPGPPPFLFGIAGRLH